MATLIVFISLVFVWAEEAPEPEYPYPKTVEKTNQLEAPKKIGPNGTYYYSKPKKRAMPKKSRGLEQPYRIGSDGSYYYGDDTSADRRARKDLEQPEQIGEDGSYYYSPENNDKKRKPRYGDLPDKVLSNGTYIYNSKEIAAENVLSLRLGVYGPPNISGSNGSSNFSSVYSSDASVVFTFDYDWELYKGIDIKLGSGIMTASGQGQFVGNSNPGLTPRESFQFYVFPNTVSLAYKFKVWDSQLFTPYADAGLGYFTFMETRSDGGKTSFGGALVASATVGLLISVGSYSSGSEMQSDYGINQTWLDLQFRQILGLDARKDFGSSMITGGFAIGF